MIVYISDPKYSTRDVLQLVNTFSKLAGYNTSSKKSIALIYMEKNWMRMKSGKYASL